MFRPCIDLHHGKVKQIVGSTLQDNGAAPQTNFETDKAASSFAELYRADGLTGGHVIMLGPGNEAAARGALTTYPGGMQIGGGITPENARDWLSIGASHVIVTSFLFRDGLLDLDRLHEMVNAVTSRRLVIDLSCRKRGDRYFVATNRWQDITQTEISKTNLEILGKFAAEFLIHAADVEGKQQGIDYELVALLAEMSPIPVTYAGGARSLDDLRQVHDTGKGRVDLTIGSALDIFGGPLPYRDVVALDRKLRGL